MSVRPHGQVRDPPGLPAGVAFAFSLSYYMNRGHVVGCCSTGVLLRAEKRKR